MSKNLNVGNSYRLQNEFRKDYNLNNYFLMVAEKAANILNIETPKINFVSEYSDERLVEKNGNSYTINIASDMPMEHVTFLVTSAIRLIWSDTNGMRADLLDSICFSVGFSSYILQVPVFDYNSERLLDLYVKDYIDILNKRINLFGNTLGPQNSWINEVNKGHIKTFLDTVSIWTYEEKLTAK